MFNNIRNRADWTDKSSSQKGFTLIELLVVIAILGVLAVVGVLSFGGLTDSAKYSTAKTELTRSRPRSTPTGETGQLAPADAAALNVATRSDGAERLHQGGRERCSAATTSPMAT